MAEQSSIRSPPPFLLAAWRAGAGLGRGRGHSVGCTVPVISGLGDLGPGEPLDSPQPPSHSRNWGNARGGGWDRAGTSLRLPSPLPPPSHRPLPGKSGPFNPTLAQKGFCWGFFFEFQGAGGWVAEDDRRDFYCFNWQCRSSGWQETKKIPCSLGPRLLRRGCHPDKMSSLRRTPSPQFKPPTEKARTLA